MADFVQSSQTKNAVRQLAAPIADVTTFDSIVASVIDSNPFGCVDYMTAGVTHEPVEKTKEKYTVRFTYETELGAPGQALQRWNGSDGEKTPGNVFRGIPHRRRAGPVLL